MTQTAQNRTPYLNELKLGYIASRRRIVEAGEARQRSGYILAPAHRMLPKRPPLGKRCELAILTLAPIKPCLASLHDISMNVALAHGYSAAEIRGPSRRQPVIHARWHAIHVAALLRPDLTFSAVGRHFGDRDHATIMNARRYWAKKEPLIEPRILAAVDKWVAERRALASAMEAALEE